MDYNITEAEKAAWDVQINNLADRLRRVRIEFDLGPGEAKNILSNLDELWFEVKKLYAQTSSDLKEITSVLYRIENKNKVGSNEHARRLAGITAAENYELEIDGELTNLNLYDISYEINRRYEQTKFLIDVITSKNNACITMTGLMKVESNFAR